MTKEEVAHIKRSLGFTVKAQGSYNVLNGETILDIIDALEQAWRELEEVKSEDAIAGLKLVGELALCEQEREALKRQHKDCLEQKEALRERVETLELGSRGFP